MYDSNIIRQVRETVLSKGKRESGDGYKEYRTGNITVIYILPLHGTGDDIESEFPERIRVYKKGWFRSSLLLEARGTRITNSKNGWQQEVQKILTD